MTFLRRFQEGLTLRPGFKNLSPVARGEIIAENPALLVIFPWPSHARPLPVTQLFLAFLATLSFVGSYAAAGCREAIAKVPWSHDSVMTFESNPFYYGGLLMEFFGPTQNSFHAWLRWLESDSLGEAPHGPGLYLGQGEFVIAKDMKFPVDAGIDQFPHGDVSTRRIVPLMSFADAEIRIMRGSSDNARAARANLLDQLNLHLFGIYGAMTKPTYDGRRMLSIAIDNTLAASIYPSMRYTATPSWTGSNSSLLQTLGDPLSDFNRVAEVISTDGRTVLVRVKLGPKNPPRNQNEEILQKMFFITHWQMVQKAYRESGLFVDSLETALYLLDDFVNSRAQSSEQNIYLLYEARAWHSMQFRMTVAHQYVAIFMRGIGLQSYHYQTISDVFYPFYPLYGMIVEHQEGNTVEFKRLFHNDKPDPLDLLRGEGEEAGLNLKFYHQVGGELPTNTKILAISKSQKHTRFYQSLGFHLDHSAFSPDWNAQKDELSVERDLFLERTRPKSH